MFRFYISTYKSTYYVLVQYVVVKERCKIFETFWFHLDSYFSFKFVSLSNKSMFATFIGVGSNDRDKFWGRGDVDLHQNIVLPIQPDGVS